MDYLKRSWRKDPRHCTRSKQSSVQIVENPKKIFYSKHYIPVINFADTDVTLSSIS